MLSHYCTVSIPHSPFLQYLVRWACSSRCGFIVSPIHWENHHLRWGCIRGDGRDLVQRSIQEVGCSSEACQNYLNHRGLQNLALFQHCCFPTETRKWEGPSRPQLSSSNGLEEGGFFNLSKLVSLFLLKIRAACKWKYIFHHTVDLQVLSSHLGTETWARFLKVPTPSSSRCDIDGQIFKTALKIWPLLLVPKWEMNSFENRTQCFTKNTCNFIPDPFFGGGGRGGSQQYYFLWILREIDRFCIETWNSI